MWNYIIFILLLLYTIFYIYYNLINDIFSKCIETSSIEQIEIVVFRTNNLSRLYKINEKTNIESIISNISKIKVKPTIRPIFSCRFKFYNIYNIVLVTKNGLIKIDFIGEKYLIVKGITYKTSNKSQLKWIQDIISFKI